MMSSAIASDPAKTYAADPVVVVLVEDQGGAGAGRQDVRDEVDLVDVAPEVFGLRGRLLLVRPCVRVEVGPLVGEHRTPEGEEPVDVPLPDVVHPRVDVDGEV